jgi:hypothetical protein
VVMVDSASHVELKLLGVLVVVSVSHWGRDLLGGELAAVFEVQSEVTGAIFSSRCCCAVFVPCIYLSRDLLFLVVRC